MRDDGRRDGQVLEAGRRLDALGQAAQLVRRRVDEVLDVERRAAAAGSVLGGQRRRRRGHRRDRRRRRRRRRVELVSARLAQ